MAALGWTALAGANLLGAGAAATAAGAATPPFCSAQTAPSFTPDPVLGSGASQYFGDAEVATIPSTATTIGIPSPTSTTGSPSSPVHGQKFAAGYLDETELYEFLNNSTSGANPAGSPGAYDATQPVLDNLPTGNVKHLDGTTSTGAGLPYAAILSSDLSHVIGTVRVRITRESYTVDPSAWMPGAKRQPASSCAGPHYAAMTFSAGSLHGLQAGTTYAAYLLVRDTDVSGPLANHLWYFTPPAVVPKVFAGYADSFRVGHSHPSPWKSSPNVIFEGCNYFHPDACPKFPSGRDRYDAGALRLDNNSTHSMTVTKASVTVGSCTFKPWPGLDATVPGGKKLILTQTGGKPPCHTTGGAYNFDASETNKSSTECTTNDGKIPVFHVTVDGQALTYRDTSQILNTGGKNPGAKVCGAHNETHSWATISGP
jgi:hypothetical protein